MRRREVAAAYEDPSSLTRRAFAAIDPLPDENDPAYRAGELPASAGIATADALARFYAAAIGDLADAPRLFSPATAELARTEESAGTDRVLLVGTRFGLGYMLPQSVEHVCELHAGQAVNVGPILWSQPGSLGDLFVLLADALFQPGDQDCPLVDG